MTTSNETEAVREAVGVFATEKSFQNAIDELLSSGFNRAELSLLASEDAVNEKLGHKYNKVEELEDIPDIPRAAYVSPETIGDAEGGVVGGLMYVGAGVLMGPAAFAGGTLAAIITAALVGGGSGALIGATLATLIGMQRADTIQEQIDHGGLLLWVRVWDEEREKKATEILSRNSGRDVHVHEFAAA